MRSSVLLLLLLGSCGSVQLVPFVGASAFSNDEYAGHVGVSFLPEPPEVAQARATFRADPDGHLDDPSAWGPTLILPAPADEPSDAELAAEWAGYFEQLGWVAPGVGAESEAATLPAAGVEADAQVADHIIWGDYRIPIASLLSALAAIGVLQRRKIAQVVQRRLTDE